MRRILILLLFALPLSAQTPISLKNPSFEVTPGVPNNDPVGPWGQHFAPGWVLSGNAGEWQPAVSEFTVPPDGPTVLWLGGGSAAQDTGVAAVSGNVYTLTVLVGRRADSLGNLNPTFTVSLGGLGGPCSQSTALNTIVSGTFAPQTLTCTAGANPSGTIAVTLAANAQQVDFDNVRLTSKSTVVPQPDSITVKAQLLWCALCDGSDNSPATGNLVVSQTNGPQSSSVIAADGTVTVGGTVDVSQDPLEFTVQLTDADGLTQAGAAMTWKFPRFELASATFLVKTVSLGIVRIAHTTDADGNPAVRLVDVSGFSIGK